MTAGTRTTIRYAAAWLVAVVAVASLSWLAIARAGQAARLLGPESPVAAALPSTAGLGEPTPPAPTTIAAPPAPPSTAPTAAAPPAHSPSPRPAGPGSTPRPAGTRPVAPSPPAVAEGALKTVGGGVIAGCVGGQPRLKSVLPADGWAFRTESNADSLEVKLTGPDSPQGEVQEIEVRVTCPGGIPKFVQE